MFERFLCILVFLWLASTILVPFPQLWCKSFDFIKNILGRNKNHYGLEWQQRGFQSLGFCDSIFVPIPASVDDFRFGYSWGEITASRKVTSSSYISRKRSRHVCLFTQRVLHRPGSLPWEFSGRYSFRVNSNSCCRFGLLIKNRYASLIRPIKFRTSDSLYDVAMEWFRQWA